MRRIVAAIATAAVAGTLLAGISYAESTHKARAAKLVRVKPSKPAKLSVSDVEDPFAGKLMPVKPMGGY